MFARLAAAIGLIAALFVVSPALADSAKSLGKFGDWGAFAYSGKGGKVCYAVGKPKRSLGSPKGREEIYLTITHRPADKSFDVVSVTAGYTYKKDSAAEMDVGGAKFDLYTTEETAWARDDKAVVTAMLKGKSLVVHGTPVKGDPTADTYSLDGFVQAHTEIGKACATK
jgi:hypothetical protein